MATFEQALDKAFEVTWQHSSAVEKVREEKGRDPEEFADQIHLASAEEAFIGAVDVLGSLLLMAGRIPSFEPSVASDTPTEGWIDGSSATASCLMDWARRNGKVTETEYAAWCAVSGTSTSAHL